ncbi:hypothetical protein BSKO_09572 [Bryopsis sp. KO-2023]|nr:hypothetical protein BSKO_09572 [Bryopsis sp. KO-2023]
MASSRCAQIFSGGAQFCGSNPLRIVKRRRLASTGKSLRLQIENKIFDPQDIRIEKSLGVVGVLNVSSGNVGEIAVEDKAELRAKLEGLETMSQDSVLAEGVQVRLYSGRVIRGEKQGARVVLKAYPGSLGADGKTCDALAANELAAHCDLQPPRCRESCSQLYSLLGGFESKTGEQWLVFHNDGTKTAAAYASKAAVATRDRLTVGSSDVWDSLDPRRSIRKREVFILKVLKQAMAALAFMHRNGRLHQSLGPNSLMLTTFEELKVVDLEVRLWDLAFSVDVSNEALYGGGTLAEIWDMSTANKTVTEKPGSFLTDGLWKRARDRGAWSTPERREFGFADDVYSAGLLFLYMVFVSLCEPGSVDGPTIQRLVEGTFRSDVREFREYCREEENWSLAVRFLDAGEGSGWALLEAMLNPEWRGRPSAAACLSHPFLTGEAFADGL